MFKELYKNIMTVTWPKESLNRETETMKKNQMEILELKSSVSNMKNSFVIFNRRFERERISELKDKIDRNVPVWKKK